MQLIGRIVGEDDRPWAISLTVKGAEFHTPELAKVRLHAVRVAIDRSRRTAVRVPAGGIAWLVAVNCQDVVDNDRVDGTLTDLSRSGVGFATQRTLRRGDRLFFHGRFFAEEVKAEVRVASVRTAPGGRTTVGAKFIDIDSANLARVDRILAGIARPEPVDVRSLRELGQVQASSGRERRWLRVFRRDA